MVGKKNVIFGFLFLATTAALGPLMVVKYDDWGVANTEKQLVVGQLQALKAGDGHLNFRIIYRFSRSAS